MPIRTIGSVQNGFLILLADGLSEHGPWMEEEMGRHLSTGQIRELIDIDRSRGGIGEEVQDLIARFTSNDDTLPPNHHRVYVTCAQLPTFVDLKKEFGNGNVSAIFEGRPFFEFHSSCTDMTRTPGDKIFFIHDVGREWDGEEQIAWGLAQRTVVAPNGYRPATHLEAYAFQKAHPNLLDYIALGSSASDGNNRRYVAEVRCRGGRRVFDKARNDVRFATWSRVLFVSKAS